MQAFRVADRRYPIFDATGARLNGGRWNSQGHGMIYTAQTYAGALMEVLVHANLRVMPKNHGLVIANIPDDLAVERVSLEIVMPWRRGDVEARLFGDRWLLERRTAVLIVPSIVLQGRENNFLINPAHPDFRRIVASDAEPVDWDERLFRRAE
jgi:RES domain-containing protein